MFDWWLGCLRSVKFNLSAHRSVGADITIKIGEVRREAREKIRLNGDYDPYLFGLSVLYHLANALKIDLRENETADSNTPPKPSQAALTYLLRRPTKQECATAEVELRPDLHDPQNMFYFLETYKYRIAFIVDTNLKTGIALAYNSWPNTPASCLKDAKSLLDEEYATEGRSAS